MNLEVFAGVHLRSRTVREMSTEVFTLVHVMLEFRSAECRVWTGAPVAATWRSEERRMRCLHAAMVSRTSHGLLHSVGIWILHDVVQTSFENPSQGWLEGRVRNSEAQWCMTT